MTYRMADGRDVIVDRYVEGRRYNVYACARGHVNLSMDVDEGVTPMFLVCQHDGCGASSESRGYPAGQPPAALFPVRIVWRRATKSELRRERRDGFDHYASGGLQREWVR